MKSSEDKEKLKKCLVNAIKIIDKGSLESEGSFSDPKDPEKNLPAKKEEIETNFAECVGILEKLQNNIDSFVGPSQLSIEQTEPDETPAKKKKIDGNVHNPSSGCSEAKDETDGKPERPFKRKLSAFQCNSEDMEDHSREAEISRLQTEEKAKRFNKEEYKLAKAKAELYKRKPISQDSFEEIPKEIKADDPQFWKFNEDDWKKRVAFEKKMLDTDGEEKICK